MLSTGGAQPGRAAARHWHRWGAAAGPGRGQGPPGARRPRGLRGPRGAAEPRRSGPDHPGGGPAPPGGRRRKRFPPAEGSTGEGGGVAEALRARPGGTRRIIPPPRASHPPMDPLSDTRGLLPGPKKRHTFLEINHPPRISPSEEQSTQTPPKKSPETIKTLH